MLYIKAARFIRVLKKLNITGWTTKELCLFIKENEYTLIVYENGNAALSITVPEHQLKSTSIKISISKAIHDDLINSNLQLISSEEDFQIIRKNKEECTFGNFSTPLPCEDCEDCEVRHSSVHFTESNELNRLDFQKYLDNSKNLGLEYSAYDNNFYSIDSNFCSVSRYLTGSPGYLKEIYYFPGKLSNVIKYLKYFPLKEEVLSIVKISPYEILLSGYLVIDKIKCRLCLHYLNVNNAKLLSALPSTLIPYASYVRAEYVNCYSASENNLIFQITEATEAKEYISKLLHENENHDNENEEMISLCSDSTYGLEIYISKKDVLQIKKTFESEDFSIKIVRKHVNPCVYALIFLTRNYNLVSTLYTNHQLTI